MRSIYLIDCPGTPHAPAAPQPRARALARALRAALRPAAAGTVQPSGNSEEDAVLKGVVRIEQLRHAEDYVAEVLRRVKPEYVRRTYGLKDWVSPTDFLEQYGRKIGKLMRGGEPDTNAAAKLVLHDWQRGRLPYFTLPPDFAPREAAEASQPDGDEQPSENVPVVAPKQPGIGSLVKAHRFLPEDEGRRGSDGEEGEREAGDESDVEASEDEAVTDDDDVDDDDAEDREGPGGADEGVGSSGEEPDSSKKPAVGKRRKVGGGPAGEGAVATRGERMPSGSAGRRNAKQPASSVSWDDVFGD
eukprot:scaffold236423_cov27-Tisochrysis_lutea.AAC.1